MNHHGGSFDGVSDFIEVAQIDHAEVHAARSQQFALFEVATDSPHRHALFQEVSSQMAAYESGRTGYQYGLVPLIHSTSSAAIAGMIVTLPNSICFSGREGRYESTNAGRDEYHHLRIAKTRQRRLSETSREVMTWLRSPAWSMPLNCDNRFEETK
jgi:hypothetical protein